ncbi:hypothetical protein V8E53_012796 [Lactarius tabidus]
MQTITGLLTCLFYCPSSPIPLCSTFNVQVIAPAFTSPLGSRSSSGLVARPYSLSEPDVGPVTGDSDRTFYRRSEEQEDVAARSSEKDLSEKPF